MFLLSHSTSFIIRVTHHTLIKTERVTVWTVLLSAFLWLIYSPAPFVWIMAVLLWQAMIWCSVMWNTALKHISQLYWSVGLQWSAGRHVFHQSEPDALSFSVGLLTFLGACKHTLKLSLYSRYTIMTLVLLLIFEKSWEINNKCLNCSVLPRFMSLLWQ